MSGRWGWGALIFCASSTKPATVRVPGGCGAAGAATGATGGGAGAATGLGAGAATAVCGLGAGAGVPLDAAPSTAFGFTDGGASCLGSSAATGSAFFSSCVASIFADRPFCAVILPFSYWNERVQSWPVVSEIFSDSLMPAPELRSTTVCLPAGTARSTSGVAPNGLPSISTSQRGSDAIVTCASPGLAIGFGCGGPTGASGAAGAGATATAGATPPFAAGLAGAAGFAGAVPGAPATGTAGAATGGCAAGATIGATGAAAIGGTPDGGRVRHQTNKPPASTSSTATSACSARVIRCWRRAATSGTSICDERRDDSPRYDGLDEVVDICDANTRPAASEDFCAASSSANTRSMYCEIGTVPVTS